MKFFTHMYLNNPSAQAGATKSQFLKQSLRSLNSIFLFLVWLPY